MGHNRHDAMISTGAVPTGQLSVHSNAQFDTMKHNKRHCCSALVNTVRGMPAVSDPVINNAGPVPRAEAETHNNEMLELKRGRTRGLNKIVRAKIP